MHPLLIVGTQMNPHMVTPNPLDSRSGVRLSRLMDVNIFDVAETSNLYEKHETVQLNVRQRVDEHVRFCRRNGIVRCVFLVMPHRAQVPHHKILTWYPAGDADPLVEVAFCPHPSGVNRWWNVVENQKLARVFWGELGEWAKEQLCLTS